MALHSLLTKMFILVYQVFDEHHDVTDCDGDDDDDDDDDDSDDDDDDDQSGDGNDYDDKDLRMVTITSC